MAFRKTVVSRYVPNFVVHMFGDFREVTSSVNSVSKVVSREFFDSSRLSLEALPMLSLDSLLRSGEIINGSVSFAPSDPAVISNSVSSVVSDYINSATLK